MKAKLLARAKEFRDDGAIIEVVVWELPEETPYVFATIEQLLNDFERDVAHWGQES